MKLHAALAIVAFFALAATAEEELPMINMRHTHQKFANWKVEHGKSYETAKEENQAFQNFAAKVAYGEKLNFFSDMTADEVANWKPKRMINVRHAHQKFDAWKAKFGKSYDTAKEENERFQIFASNLIDNENLNHFSDMTEER